MMERYALLSPDGVYRYTLSRRWGPGAHVLWVMLNPSTADAFEDDATIRKCIGFSKTWGYEAMMVVNLFALRSRDPGQLLKSEDPHGPENRRHVRVAIRRAPMVVLGWGGFLPRPKSELSRYNVEGFTRKIGKIPYCLGVTNSGQPRHPLMLAYNTPLAEFGA